MPTLPEDREVLEALATPLGQAGSGRVRYAAAMHFNRLGRLSDAALEVYRICSVRDRDDPAAMLAERRIGAAPVLQAAALAALVAEAGRYLDGLEGPGLAECRQGLARWRNGAVSPVAGAPNPVTAEWLAPALAALRVSRPALAAAIGAASPHLAWRSYDGYPPDEIGAAFARGHAYAPLIGEGAPIAADDWELGLFLVAPHVLYRDHCHAAPELYAPLTGPHGWRFRPDQPLTILPAHQPVWNPPDRPHLTKVGPVPFLCFYIWTREVNALARVLPARDWPALEALRLGQ